MQLIENREAGTAVTLADLRPGQLAKIVNVKGSGAVRNRLWELGFRCGEEVELVRKAPLADPLEFRIKGGHISLRRYDARAISVAPID